MRLRRPMRPAVGLLGLILAVVSGLLFAIPPAHGADDQLVQVRFSEVTVPTSGDGPVVLAGTITNSSGGPLHNLQAMAWRDRTPLDTPEELHVALDSAPTQPLGQRVCCRLGSFQDLTTPETPLPDGAEVDFRLELDFAELELPDQPGAYLIGIHVRGSTDGSAPWTVGRARTFALRTTPDAPNPTITSVVVLSSRPSMISNDLLIDDHLAAELAEGGRLDVLLDSAAREDVTHAIDPALLDEIIQMSDGYQVLRDGSRVDGDGAAAADEWLSKFAELTGDRYRLPYAMPDLSALADLPENAGAELASYAQQAGSAVPAVADAPLLMLTSGNEWTPQALHLANQYVPAAIVAGNAAHQDVFLDGRGGAPVVRTDPAVYGGGPSPEPQADRIRIRQRLHAEALVTALVERDVPIRIVNTVTAAELDDTTPTGTQRRTLTELLAGDPSMWSGHVDWTDAMERARLQPEQLALVEELATFQNLFDDLLVDSATQQVTARQMIGRGTSSWWRGESEQQQAFLAPATTELRRIVDGESVFVRAPSRVTLSMREGTTFPATITNTLDRAVKVRPEFESGQGQRIQFPEQPLVLVEPGQSVTVNVEPVAEVNGTVEVTGHLVTEQGFQLGEAVVIVVEVTDLGLAGWVIVGISGIVLIGTTTLRIRQVRARQLRGGSA